MITKILVEQEYGWKHWLWTSNGTFEEMKENFHQKINESGEEYFCNSPKKDFGGEWEEIDYELYRKLLNEPHVDGWAHVHEDHDSDIRKIN
jgi:hypothetical protein